ncbi:MAG: phosphoribosylamine--glycine ligase [Gemmatimonadetes bacterium]|jgi:phosphoribosylamine---glycine ligase|nr:phosphoribosylamine--glycine ligase [Gemmatimonadota bacterium]MBT6147074.1 phosphoribosylamine--glycine ligase [Gemmatimonadota bacterium]MBT7863541.1 phosphoribosylamine--glycine ligase [Gemmatimonadota bacterium]
MQSRDGLLVIGSGGREHALVWKLAQSPSVERIWCAPGNAGIGAERCARTGNQVECLPISAEDVPALVALAQELRPDLTVVGPDNPLALGVVDRLQDAGHRVWGPNQRAALIESSKTFSQKFMEDHGVPTAAAGAFTDPGEAKSFAAGLGGRCAVKADGLALGKGVTICTSLEEAGEAIDAMLLEKALGSASHQIVIQELLEGPEISLHAFCDGETVKLFPTSQDHKRAFDADLGPNTGGMGAYCPTPFLSAAELEEVGRQVLDPWRAGCAREDIDFRGLLYPGVILTPSGPKVFEFNARFGDPEAQIYLPMLETDLLEILEASVDGCLDQVSVRWAPGFAVCVVMASGGYPGSYETGKVIEGLQEADELHNTKVFHAATVEVDGTLRTNGGRVLGVTAWRDSLQEAQTAAYAAVDRIRFDGAFCRRDIASKAL